MLTFCADSSKTSLSFALAAEESGEKTLVKAMSYQVCGKINETFFSALEQFLSANDRTVYDIDRWVIITLKLLK